MPCMCFRLWGDQMVIEPAAGQLGNLLQSAGLLEQMARARDNLEASDAVEPAQCSVIEIDHHGIESPHDQQRWRPHLLQRTAG